MFAPNSRYQRVPEAAYVDAAGRTRPYVLLRPFPAPAPTRQTYELGAGERLDLVAYRFYGDPEQFWRICDANHTLRPDDLEAAGTTFSIPIVVS